MKSLRCILERGGFSLQIREGACYLPNNSFKLEILLSGLSFLFQNLYFSFQISIFSFQFPVCSFQNWTFAC
ncbi:hypothetical protein B4100_0044 [Heyndrickxia coagulans]|nr:hypothetical protein B4100_0044 [Heyndrickxia coagulans]